MGRSIKCPKCQLWFSAEKYTSCPHCLEIAEEQAVKKAREKVITDAVVAYLQSEDAAKKEAAAKEAAQNAAEKEEAAKAAAKAAVDQAIAEKKAAEMMAAAAADEAAEKKKTAEMMAAAPATDDALEKKAAEIMSAASDPVAELNAPKDINKNRRTLVERGKSYVMPEFLQAGKKAEVTASSTNPVMNSEITRTSISQSRPVAEKLPSPAVQWKTKPDGTQSSVSRLNPAQGERQSTLGMYASSRSELPASSSKSQPASGLSFFSSIQQQRIRHTNMHIAIRAALEPVELPADGTSGKKGNIEEPLVTIGWLVGLAGTGYGTNISLYKGRNLIYALNPAAQDAFSQNTSAQNASAQNASAWNASVQNASVQNASAWNASVQNASAQNASAWNAAGKDFSERICAVILESPKNGKPAIYPGLAGSNCLINGEKVEGEVILNRYDCLIFEEDPDCVYLYIPLENSQFNWNMFER